ncbi:MAG: leucine-rich repeat domain-containing protein [Clostridia bacterium]|nr:leucine-rich repeat domain-containing protein [Clostridia bacterium]
MYFKWNINPINHEGEIGLKSDNEAVIKSREPMGILPLALEENIGTANVTIYSVDNPEICDTIKITVIGENDEGITEAEQNIVSGKCGDNLTWTLNKSTGRLDIKGTGKMNCFFDAPWCAYKDYIKKAVIADGVKTVGCGAFMECDKLTKMIIPNSVETIEPQAFYECYNLQDIILKNGLKKIMVGAFQHCESLLEITIPDSVTNMEEATFWGCYSLRRVCIGRGLTYIPESSFYGCSNLSDVVIGENVYSIGNSAFSNCGLTNIIIPDSVQSISAEAFLGCDLESITLPDSVTYIGYRAFYYTDIKDVYYMGTEEKWKNISVDLGNEKLLNATIHFVVDTETHTHVYNSLITTPATCTQTGIITYTCDCGDSYMETMPPIGHTIGGWQVVIEPTFETEGKKIKTCTDCSVTLEESIIEAFPQDIITGKCGECVNWYLNKETGALFIGGTGDMYNYNIDYDAPWKDYCFSIVDLYICDGVRSIGDWSFCMCKNLVTVIASNSVEIIGKNAFSGCTSLTEIKVGDGVTKIDENAFSGCSKLEKVFLSKNVRNICGWAFYQCESLSEIILPDTLESIGKSAFNYCCKLTKISIPASVTSIGDYAFYNCENLINISVHKDNIFYSSDEIGVMFNKNKTILINYPVGSLGKTYSIPETVKSIEYGAFYNGENLEEISIPYGVERIGACSFADCDSITSLSIPDSVTYIGEEAFYYCDELSEIKIGNGLTIINRYSFAQCHKLVTVEIPVSVKQISYQAFDCSENITDVYYLGTEEQWRDVSIGSGNEYLSNAFIHFKDIVSDVPKEPVKDTAVVKNPSTSTISYGDAIILHVDESKIPEGGRVEWTASNNNFSWSADGDTCKISPKSSGDTTFTATIYDAEGNPVSIDEQTMTSKAGFFDKIIAFFKSLFGLTKTYENVYKGIIR